MQRLRDFRCFADRTCKTFMFSFRADLGACHSKDCEFKVTVEIMIADYSC